MHLPRLLPTHAGFGSGTQLALAIGRAFAQLNGIGLSTTQIASSLGRGLRSGVGIAGFERGGLLLDGGPNADGTAASEKVTTYDYYTGGSSDDCPFPMAAGPVVRTTVTDPVGGKTVHYFDGNGMENKTETQTSSGTVLQQHNRSYQSRTAGYVVGSEYVQQGSVTLWGNGYEYDRHGEDRN